MVSVRSICRAEREHARGACERCRVGVVLRIFRAVRGACGMPKNGCDAALCERAARADVRRATQANAETRTCATAR
eukprot:9056399-Lingulodinium_polyedra.AAC.1